MPAIEAAAWHKLGQASDPSTDCLYAKVLAISVKFLSVTARLTQGLMASLARARRASPNSPNYMVEPEGPVSADQSKNPKGQFESRSRQPSPKGPAQPKAPNRDMAAPSQDDHAGALSRALSKFASTEGTNRALSGTKDIPSD